MNELRGSVDGWDFKSYVLGMLCYRFISENLATLIEKNEGEGFSYAELTDEQAEQIRGMMVDENLNETLEKVFQSIEGSSVGHASEDDLKGLFDDLDVNSTRLGNTVERRNEKLRKLLNAIGELDMGEQHDEGIDMFGDAYEFLMQVYASQAGKSGGEYYTPQEVSELLARLTVIGKKQVQRVYDPTCGSGNFLTETYLSLRRLENKVISELFAGQTSVSFDDVDISPIKVSLNKFYGLEINDFAVAVAGTALWIAELQANLETEMIVTRNIESLPLSDGGRVVHGNALETDWDEIIPAQDCDYIIGNPPFLGARNQSAEQKAEIKTVFEAIGATRNLGEIDYVAAWYAKATKYMGDHKVRSAFVSTNSICQGAQVANIWHPLYEQGIRIDFAHDTFKWANESNDQAAVYCVIVGFSKLGEQKSCTTTPISVVSLSFCIQKRSTLTSKMPQTFLFGTGLNVSKMSRRWGLETSKSMVATTCSHLKKKEISLN
ncbi:DNA methyltransferase [Micrococcoides hystricis]|uniref:site-specific DNA-methyltransferase (adenine-specific) n=1 Tax=Micrococcoides hystricis TaxID=1572761 RepID=A0ABV6PCX8_9MICC